MFSPSHKQKLSEALKRAWQTKRQKAEIGETRIIRGKLRIRCKSTAGWLYWKVLNKPQRDISKLSSSMRSRLRKRGFDIPKRKPGCKPGFKRSVSTRLKQSVSARKYLLDVTAIAKEQKHRIRKSLVYRLWRDAVFIRDNYTCQRCGAHSQIGAVVALEAHHKKSYSRYKNLRFEVSNGLTLCRPCHIRETSKRMLRNKNGRRKVCDTTTQMHIL